jgi:RHS repeat-associated protein
MLDPSTGRTTTLATPLDMPRAWHTATVLPDGGVLIAGGIDASGKLAPTIERFDVGTATFQTLSSAGLLARSHHTATLLSDGRILFTGGIGHAGRPLDTADLWHPTLGGSPVSSFLEAPRSGHSATLLADGRVALSGGRTGNGRYDAVEIFDPSTESFQTVTAVAPEAGEQVPLLTGAVPANGAVDVELAPRITLRFSPPLDVRSLTDEAVRLTTADGDAVSIFVVPAENGRLAFVTPAEPLTASTTYTLSLQGALDTRNRAIQPSRLQFTTKAAPADAGAADDEEWLPDGEGWRSNRPPSPWQSLPPLAGRAGVTAVAGQVLKLNGAPLRGVTFAINGHKTESDRTGRFVLEVPEAASGFHVLEIEGASASTPGRTYGRFEARVTVEAGQTTPLRFTIWMPRIATAYAVAIPSPTRQETVVTSPLIPGLELHLPPNTVIRNEDGEVVRELTITPIPLDRPPFPLPEYFEPPVYFTIQPGGAYVYTYGSGPRGAHLVYPNSRNYPTDSEIEFWHYDPKDKGWFVYGTGRVTTDRRQVKPKSGVAIYDFTGAMINGDWTPPWDWPLFKGWRMGDPVDLATGLFVMEKTDLYLPDVIPLALTRTYRQGDSQSRPFGIGSSHPFAMFLWSAQQYQEADLILPDTSRIHFVRTSAGTGVADAVFEHTSSPSRFYKSVITWNGNGWDLRLKDGLTYVFGNEAPLQSIRDRFGNKVTLTWSNANMFGAGYNKILKVTASSGRFFEFTYDGSNRITQAKDNIGRTVGYQYDASGRLWKVTDPVSGVTEYTYDTSHRMLTIKDARGIVYLTNEYDANGRVTLQTQADDTTFDFAYTVNAGKVTQADLTNPRGYTDRWVFNADGHVTSHVEAVGTAVERTTTFTRQSGSNFVTRVIDELDRETAYTYDTAGNLTSISRLDGTADEVTTTFSYESTYQQLASITDPLDHTTTFAYDSLGRLVSITDPLNHATTMTYNALGLPLTITNALNKTTQLAYDVTDLVSITDPLGRTTTRFLDPAGRTIRVTNPLAQSRLSEYDAANRVTRVVDALAGETEFTYDANGNLLTVTDARNNTTTYTYNDMDRVATRTDPLDREEAYAYDENGNLAQVIDRKAQETAYSYDALDRMTSVTYDDASTTAYTYDAGDRLTEVDDSIAGVITREWDGLDRLVEEDTPEGLVSYTYDDANRRASMTVDGQSAVSYTYDNADRLTDITQGSANVDFSYDSADRRTSLTLPNGIQVAYTFDDADQITGITYSLGQTTLGTLTHTYDLAGNRATIGGSWARTGLPSAMASASYDAANQITSWNSTTFTYDANGNLTDDGPTTYTWNARNALTGLTGGVSASFAYDGLGRRRSRTVNSTTLGFLHDGPNLVQESTAGTPTAHMLNGLTIDEIFTRSLSGGTETLLTDAIGNTLALADGSGTVQTQYTYEPYGASSVSGTPSSLTAQFTGRDNDGTGLYYYRARYYSPAVQRFISEDPIEYAAGDLNLHQYVFGAPTTLTDPSGEIAPVVAACLSGGAFDLTLYIITNGRKATFGGGASAAARGCGAGVVGFGVGKAFSAAASAASRGLSRAAKARAATAAARANKPPKWDTDWEFRRPESIGKADTESWFDPHGGEYHWDNTHGPELPEHWDFNPWTEWNSGWTRIFP